MKEKKDGLRIVFLLVFFLSGVSALIYQVTWIKMLGQVFGLTIFAVTTVLTAFMGGLALGSYFFGRLIDRIKDHLLAFILLEAGIGAFAFVFPFALDLSTAGYLYVTGILKPDAYADNMLRFAFSSLLLLVPTTLMGGTLPVLSKYYIRNTATLGGSAGSLYSINNLGAVLGCFLSSFVLIQVVGLAWCMYIAAIVNIAVAAAVMLLRKKASELTSTDTSEPENKKAGRAGEETYPRYVLRLVLWVFAIEGFTTLSYEVIWTRILLGISYDKSAYFFATVIISFIAGLSIGSFIVARFVDRKRNLVFLLGILEIVIGIIACAVLLLFAGVSGYFTSARPFYTEPWLLSLGKEYLIFFLLMIVPTTLMGMTFPIVAKVYTTNIERLGSKIGIIGCLDTIGSILGSFVAGFVLIPFIGVVKSVVVTALINVILGLALVLFNPYTKPRVKTVSVLVTAIAAVAVFLMVPQEQYFRYWQTAQEDDRLLYYKEGLGSTISVPQKFDGVKELAIDGAVTAIAEYGDIRVHKLLAYLPYLFSEEPESALIVGFGMGVTVESLMHKGMKNVTCVEISSEIITGSSRYFEKENKKVLANPELRVVIEDGRSYMAASRESFDVITTNAIHPRLSINIYTREFYELCKSRLTEKGVMCQWMTTNWLIESEYKMLLKSFTDVFPNTSVWVSNIGHVLLLGTPSPLIIDFTELEKRMSERKTKGDLGEVHLDDPLSLLALYACGSNVLEKYLKDTLPATDDFPLPEMSKAISTLPNLEITDDIIDYPRDAENIVANLREPALVQKLSRLVDAERYFIKARYAAYDPSIGDEIRLLEDAVRLNPNNYHFRNTLGDALTSIENFGRAEKEYEAAISLDQANPLGYLSLAYTRIKQEKFDDALSSAGKALELDPGIGLGHYLESIAYRLKARFDEAATGLEYVTANFPGFSHAVYELGEVYFASAKYDKAKAEFVKYSSLVPEDGDVKAIIEELEKMGY